MQHLEPTEHEPGTKAKIEILAQRASRGEPLAHPEDKSLMRADEPDLPQPLAPNVFEKNSARPHK